MEGATGPVGGSPLTSCAPPPLRARLRRRPPQQTPGHVTVTPAATHFVFSLTFSAVGPSARPSAPIVSPGAPLAHRTPRGPQQRCKTVSHSPLLKSAVPSGPSLHSCRPIPNLSLLVAGTPSSFLLVFRAVGHSAVHFHHHDHHDHTSSEAPSAATFSNVFWKFLASHAVQYDVPRSPNGRESLARESQLVSNAVHSVMPEHRSQLTVHIQILISKYYKVHQKGAADHPNLASGNLVYSTRVRVSRCCRKLESYLRQLGRHFAPIETAAGPEVAGS